MRWDALAEPDRRQPRLPGTAGAVVRTFDAPEALGIRFHEIQAKSALNRVPAASRMPFEWTINPYRGCTHACVYCLGGETPILMADGTTKPIADIRVGDRVHGTVRRGNDRHCVPTDVLAHWSTVKSAYRVRLEDGTEIVASGDHRFLTRRGWRHVTGATRGAARRPHLTRNDRLLGVGSIAAAPPDSPSHRRGFDVVVESAPERTAVRNVRIRGGLRERLRFHHTVAPAISRRRSSLDDVAVRGPDRLRVVAVEPMGLDLPLYDITTGSGDFVANGVISHNCFARPTHTYLDLDAGRDFEREIIVKANLPEVLRAELARPSWGRHHVALGTNTDPYQWVEKRYAMMPEVWRALLQSGTPGSILTKSPLLLRDIDVMRELVDGPGFQANLSIPTLDEKAWRQTEPHTPSPRARIEAVAALSRAGIPTGVLIAPLMPGINDAPEQVERILELVTEAGATSVGGITLHLRDGVRGVFMSWLRGARPDLVERYERLYERRAYVRDSDRHAIERPLRERPRAGRRALRGRPQSGAAARAETGRIEGEDVPGPPRRERRHEALQLF